MIEISQIKLRHGTGEEILKERIIKSLKLGRDISFTWKITRHSIDARKHPDLFDVYSVSVEPYSMDRAAQERLVNRLRDRNIRFKESSSYQLPEKCVPDEKSGRPVVIGAGPAGLFCALILARCGMRPIILERGRAIDQRTQDVEKFWAGGVLDPNSNVQFGEGGAGTFSDGKLTSNVRDSAGRTDFVLQTFTEHGAPEDIQYENLPHIGTDLLRNVIRSMREELLSLGAEVRFESLVTDFVIRDGKLIGLKVLENGQKSCVLDCRFAAAALGHSARDTIRRIYDLGIPVEQKNFAIGMRVSHPQAMIDARHYGIADPEKRDSLQLPASSYKVTAKADSGRGVYSFCMCPGGYVVNASSEPGRLCVNGMSDHARDSKRANAAVIITVGKENFGSDHPLAGMYFQERLEERAFHLAGGAVPVQPFQELETCYEQQRAQDVSESAAHQKRTEMAGPNRPAYECRPLSAEETDQLCIRGGAAYAPLHKLLPSELTADFIEGMHCFDSTIPGFTGPDALCIGLESRTSSPVRIPRDESGMSGLRGLFPCGEGAGYAGGILSAAVDGIKTAENILRVYNTTDKAAGSCGPEEHKNNE